MRIRIYTDGACSDNPGPGGWAAVFNTSSECIKIAGFEKTTTNNRMELKAVVQSLLEISNMSSLAKSMLMNVELFSDSAYVINAINNNWIEKWKMNGWKTTKNDDVKNRDLWEEFYKIRKDLINDKIEIKFVKIKGHSGNTFNEMVDKLAKEQVQIAKENI